MQVCIRNSGGKADMTRMMEVGDVWEIDPEELAYYVTFVVLYTKTRQYGRLQHVLYEKIVDRSTAKWVCNDGINTNFLPDSHLEFTRATAAQMEIVIMCHQLYTDTRKQPQDNQERLDGLKEFISCSCGIHMRQSQLHDACVKVLRMEATSTFKKS
jgi:uncharacterized protein (UPF0371 family)